MDRELLILGGGPAGLACAMELSRRGRASTIVERDDQVGGLAKTLRIVEGVPIALLLGACVALAGGGEAAMGYMRAAAAQLHTPAHYIGAVKATRSIGSPESSTPEKAP